MRKRKNILPRVICPNCQWEGDESSAPFFCPACKREGKEIPLDQIE